MVESYHSAELNATPLSCCQNERRSGALQRWIHHHYDAHVARTCKPGTARWFNAEGGINESVVYPLRFQQPQKLGLCQSDGIDGHNELYQCHDQTCAAQSVEGHVVPDLPNDVTTGYVRWQDNSLHVYHGGDPLDPNG